MRPRLLCALALAIAAAIAPAAAPRAQAPAPRLVLPLACEIGRTCEVQHYVDRDPGPGALDYRCGHRTYDKHDGIDFRILDMAAQRAGVDVVAAAPGKVLAVRDGVQDISIRAPGAPSVAGHECGNRVAIGLGGGWIIDYCHLAQGSLKVKAGDTVAVGQPLAHVGLSGDTEFPHLHFSVRHANAVVDPFAPQAAGGCVAASDTLWAPAVAAALAYKYGEVLNVGFAPGAVSMQAVEAGAPPGLTTAAPLVAYARLIGLEAGDGVEVTLAGPNGATLAVSRLPALDAAKDQVLAFAGARPPAGGWPHGAYAADVIVRRGGAVVISRRWERRL